MAGKPDPYDVLGVAKSASQDEISAAYRRMAIQFHPDKNPGDHEAVENFKQAAEAFEILGDQDTRARYDRFGHAGVDAMGGSPHFGNVEDIFSAFGDLFGDILGGQQRGGRRRVRRGRDIHCDVSMTLLEAARGTDKTVIFQRHERCADCQGSGARPGTSRKSCHYCGGQGQVVQSSGIFRVQTTCPACQGEGSVIEHPCRICDGGGFMPKRVETEVHIPAGVDNGMQVRISGEGEPSPNGGPPGDCYCSIAVDEHPLFERDGRHLICRVPIAYSQAALGATIEVPTLDGPDEHVIPPGTQSGQVFRLRGRGMPDPRRGSVGDLLVQVNVEVPSQLTEREEELLRELATLEHANVSPHRKTFFEKLKEYFVGEDEDKRSED